MKAGAVFSGARVWGILCGIIKTKLVALWLGPEGIGLLGIFNTTIDTVSTATGLELRNSSVRSIALSVGNRDLLARQAAVVEKCSAAAGLLGAVVMSALAPLLSQWFFNSPSRWWCFLVLSGCMLFNAMMNGTQAIMQGTGALKALARSSVWGATIGTIVSIPLFRFFGESSVCWSLLAYSLATFIAARVLRVRTRRIEVAYREAIKEGRSFLRLGVYMAVAAWVANAANLLFMAWLSHTSSVAEVGYYQAGNTLVVRYVGIIFGAVAMEYYPRLSAHSDSKWRMEVFVNHEITLLMTVLAPLVIWMMVLKGLLVGLLYSREFEATIPYIAWAIQGCAFRAASFSMAYVMLARGDGRKFMAVESADAVIGLGLNIVCYHFMGIAGLGVAYAVWYFGYMLITGTVYRGVYKMHLRRGVAGMISACVVAGALAFIACELLPMLWSVGVAAVLTMPFIFAFARMIRR